MLTEYRQRVETNPQGKLSAELLASAFEAHPYRNPQGGLPGEYLEFAPHRGYIVFLTVTT